MCVTKRPSPRPAGPCQGNIPLLSAPLTKQNRSTVKPRHARLCVRVCVCRYECVFVHWEAVKCDGLVTRTMESYGARASQLFNLATWADTERKGEYWRETVSIYDVCCVSKPPLYHCVPCSVGYAEHISAIMSPHTHTKWQGCIWRALALGGG